MSFPSRTALIGLGGAAGAGLRWAVGELWVTAGGWPWATLVVNIIGCAALGGLLAIEGRLRERHETVREALAVGFCGGLTTFSTFALEVARFADGGRLAMALGYGATSLVTGVAAFGAAEGVVARRIGEPPADLAIGEVT